MGGEEVPPVDPALADIVANDLLPDAAGLHETGRVVDHGDGGPDRLLIRQVARLGQDDHTGVDALRLFVLGNLARLVCPEDEGAVL